MSPDPLADGAPPPYRDGPPPAENSQDPPAAVGAERPLRPLSGGRVVASGLVTGAAGLALAQFLRTVVAHTPVRVSERTLFWDTVLVSGFGLVAGMAVEAVRQLQLRSPDLEYQRGRRSGGRGAQAGPGGEALTSPQVTPHRETR